MTCVSATLPTSPVGRFSGRTVDAGGVRWTIGRCVERTVTAYETTELYEVACDAPSCLDRDGRRRLTRRATEARWCSDPDHESERWRIGTDGAARDEWSVCGSFSGGST